MTSGFSSDTFSGANQKFSGDAFAGANQKFSDDASSGATQKFSPAAYASAQERSLVDFADNDGLAPESMTDNTWNNTGYYYVRVSGRSGAFDPVQPFSLHLAQSGNVCAGLTAYTPGSAVGPAATGRKTIIIYDSNRITTTATGAAAITEKQALLDELNALASRTEVAGKVVDVSAIPVINSLNAQAVARAGCPYAKNLVAMAIKDVVDSYPRRQTRWPTSCSSAATRRSHSSVTPTRRTSPRSPRSSRRSSRTASPTRASSSSYVLSQDAYGAGRAGLARRRQRSRSPTSRSAGSSRRPLRPRACSTRIALARRHGVVATPTRRSSPATTSWPTPPTSVQANFAVGHRRGRREGQGHPDPERDLDSDPTCRPGLRVEL